MKAPRDSPFFQSMKPSLKLAMVASLILSLQACAVVAVADAAVTVVKVTAKAVGAVADAVIPD